MGLAGWLAGWQGRRGYLHTHITHIYLCRTDAAAGGRARARATTEGRDDAGHGDPKDNLGREEMMKHRHEIKGESASLRESRLAFLAPSIREGERVLAT